MMRSVSPSWRHMARRISYELLDSTGELATPRAAAYVQQGAPADAQGARRSGGARRAMMPGNTRASKTARSV
jgi:hypothetical protein